MGTDSAVEWCTLCKGYHPTGMHWVQTNIEAPIKDCETCGLPVTLCECHDISDQQTAEEKFDKMVAKASAPSLSELIKAGLSSGVLHHEHSYVQGKQYNT